MKGPRGTPRDPAGPRGPAPGPVALVAEGLGVAWNTANDAVLAEGKRVLIDDSARFDNVLVIGVDEHARHGDKYVTVIIDLTTIRDGTGTARLLDMVEGRSKQVFKTWFAARTDAWRDGVEVVAMDGFSGFKTATTEELPDAVAVMDPFHVVRLAGDALDRCRRRVQLAILAVFVAVGGDHPLVDAPGRLDLDMLLDGRGRDLMTALIDSVSKGVPAALVEVVTLGRTLKKRADDVLAYFDRPGTGNGPTEAINGRLETPPRLSTRVPQTSPTTSPEACSRHAGSDHDYTLNREEPGRSCAPPRRTSWAKRCMLDWERAKRALKGRSVSTAAHSTETIRGNGSRPRNRRHTAVASCINATMRRTAQDNISGTRAVITAAAW